VNDRTPEGASALSPEQRSIIGRILRYFLENRLVAGLLTAVYPKFIYYSGAVVTLSPELDGFGFVVGEESIRLTGKGAA